MGRGREERYPFLTSSPGTVGTCDVVQQRVLGHQLYPRQGKVGGRAVRILVWWTWGQSTACVVPTHEEKWGQFLGRASSVNNPSYLWWGIDASISLALSVFGLHVYFISLIYKLSIPTTKNQNTLCTCYCCYQRDDTEHGRLTAWGSTADVQNFCSDNQDRNHFTMIWLLLTILSCSLRL